MAAAMQLTVEPQANPGELFLFPRGLIGFASQRRFALVGSGDVQALRSTEADGLSFVVMDPRLIVPEYEVEISAEDAAAIGLKQPEDAWIRVVLARLPDTGAITCNLRGPIILNPLSRMGVQVMADSAWSIRHELPGV